MLLKQSDIVVIKKESIKEYGAAGAIIVQSLNEIYGHSCKLQLDNWCSPDGIFWYMDARSVRIVLNQLMKKGLITILDDTIILSSGAPKKEYKPVMLVATEKPAKTKMKEPSTIYTMAKFLVVDIFKYNPQLITPKSQLRLSKKLIDQDVTIEELKELYGENSWWYNNYWKGQKGFSPKPKDILETLEDARSNKTYGIETETVDEYWS